MRLVDYLSEHYAPGSGHAGAIATLSKSPSAIPWVLLFLFGEKHKIIGRPGSGIMVEIPNVEDALGILRTETIALLQASARGRLTTGFCSVDRQGNPLAVSNRYADHAADAFSYAMFSGRSNPREHITPQRVSLCVSITHGHDPYRIEELDSLIADIHKQVTLYSLTGSWNTLASQPGNL